MLFKDYFNYYNQFRLYIFYFIKMDETINLNRVLDTISNEIIIDFAKKSNYEQVIEKEKLIKRITTNINVIKKLYENKILYDENTINNIINTLKNLKFTNNTNTNINTLSHYKKIRKTLGHVIFDIYRYSGYHILMSNIPLTAIPVANNKMDDIDEIETVNSEVMYDTIQHYIGLNTVDNIFQVTESNYIVKMKKLDNIPKMCNLLNKMQINNNVIKVEALQDLQELQALKDLENPIIEDKADKADDKRKNIDLVKNESNDTNNLISSNISVSNIDLDKEDDKEDDENIIHISMEIEEPKHSLVSNLAYGIYNKISSVFSFFRRS